MEIKSIFMVATKHDKFLKRKGVYVIILQMCEMG